MTYLTCRFRGSCTMGSLHHVRFLGLLLLVSGCADAEPNGGGTDSTVDAGDTLIQDAARDPEDIGPTDGESVSDTPDATPDAYDSDGADAARDVVDQDAGLDTSTDAEDGGRACALATPGHPDRIRTVLLGFPFGPRPGEDGTEIGGLSLLPTGELVDDGTRLDVGTRVSRIAFVPSGQIALALGEDGILVSVEVVGADDLAILDAVELPSAGYGDIFVHDDGVTLSVTGSNVAETSGVSIVTLDCDQGEAGQMTVLPDAFLNIRLTDSMAILPTKDRAVLLGGQAVFEPVDENDLRLLAWEAPGWREVSAFDIYGDFIDADKIALSPDGAQLLVPNGSPFSEEGAQVAVVAVEGELLTESQRLREMPDARGAAYLPDGTGALVTLGEPGRVRVLRRRNQQMEVLDTELRVGLAKQLAVIHRGPLRGVVLAPAIDPRDGPQLVVLRTDGPDHVTISQRLPLGAGAVNIPDAVAVVP